MNNSASEKLLQAVQAAKDQAVIAEKDYNQSAEILKTISSRSINLYGHQSVSQVSYLVSESKKICDSLYATYQTLVKMLDDMCRPLLDNDPDPLAVKAVRDMIVRLNDESEIENNFTASFNHRDLGDIAARRYFPSIENKMIQSFWEAKYNMWPGRAKAEAAEERRQEDEETKLNQAREDDYSQKLAEYEKAHAAWQKKSDEILTLRSDELASEIASLREARIKQLDRAKETEIKHANAEIISCEQWKAEAEATLASLGMFKFAEKKTAKKTIEQMSEQISQARNRIVSAEQIHSQEMGNLNSWCDHKKSQYKKELESKYPLPPEPIKPKAPAYKRINKSSSGSFSLSNDEIKTILLTELDYGELYTIADIRYTIPELEDISNQQLAYALHKLEQQGEIKKEVRRRNAYFGLV